MKYKNKSNQVQSLIGFGVINPNEVIETDVKINNPNFEIIQDKKIEEVSESDLEEDVRFKSKRKTS